MILPLSVRTKFYNSIGDYLQKGVAVVVVVVLAVFFLSTD